MVNYSTNINKINNHLSPKESINSDGQQIQHYVIKFVSDLRQVSDFLWVLWFLLPIKLTAMI
jgi:hypothetical protein